MQRKNYCGLTLLILILSVIACSFYARPIYKSEEKKTAEKAIIELHQRSNDERYDLIFDQADEFFKRNRNKDATFTSLKDTHERIGKILQITQKWMDVKVAPAPVEVMSVLNLKCEKGEYTEKSLWYITKDGSKALLANYQLTDGYSNLPEESK